MAAGIANKTIFNDARQRKTINQNLTAVGDVSDWVLCQRDIAVQITGVATAVTAVVERSTVNPTQGGNPAPVATDPISGNASTGITVAQFYEPGSAWWRVRLTALTGASVDVGIATSGE